MKIFIAGARAITRLDDNVKNKLSSICEKGYDVLVGDANGVDSSVQKFYADRKYDNVTVFASNGSARNNLGEWNVENVPVTNNLRGFEFYEQKDIAMANTADYGFMIWNGESKGTLNNILNLISQNKTCGVYFSNNCYSISDEKGLLNLLKLCPSSTAATYRKLTKAKASPLINQIAMF